LQLAEAICSTVKISLNILRWMVNVSIGLVGLGIIWFGPGLSLDFALILSLLMLPVSR